MAPIIPTIPFAEIKPRLSGLIHQGRSGAQADIHSLEWEGNPAVLKDFSARQFWIRWTWGRIIIAREYRALRRLWGVEGIPKIYARVGSYGIVMERLNAKRLPRNRETAPSLEYFDRAKALICALHEKGIGHGDIRRLNLLMDDAGKPYLIDFATAVQNKEGIFGWPFRILFGRYSFVDLHQLAKMKSNFYPDHMTEEEKATLVNLPWDLRIASFFKQKVLRLRKRRYRARTFVSFKLGLRYFLRRCFGRVNSAPIDREEIRAKFKRKTRR